MSDVFSSVRNDPTSVVLAGLPPTWRSLRHASGGTLLHHAVEYEKSDLAMELIHRGIDPNVQDRQGKTVLHLAAEFHQFEVAKVALAHGANPRLVDGWGNSPLWTAVFHSKMVPGLARMYVLAGGDPAAKNQVGRSPLDLAESYGAFGASVMDELRGS